MTDRRTPTSPLRVFVPGPLVNPLRGAARGHWSKHHRWSKGWRERTAERLRIERLLHPKPWAALGEPTVPKQIIFSANTARTWDTDNLQAGMKPMRDALQDAQIIDNDRPESGHSFMYEQRIAPGDRGVWISVERKGG